MSAMRNGRSRFTCCDRILSHRPEFTEERALPNLHWFGSEDDHATLLSQIFAMNDFVVFELYSEPGQSIRTFSNVDETLAEFQVPHSDGTPKTTLNLNLWVKGAGPNPSIEKVKLLPEKNNGHSWRERSGAGCFVLLYLERYLGGRINYSQTNTPSEARMGAVDGIVTGWDGAKWDVRKANHMSSKLNRLIRKKAVAKVAACPILPGADALWKEGASFGYHWSLAKTPELYAVA